MRETLVFYILSGCAVVFALSVIMQKKLIFSALSLVLVMLTVAGLFFSLSAHLLGGVQTVISVSIAFIFLLVILRLTSFEKIQKKSQLHFLWLRMLIVGCFCGFLLAIVNKTFVEKDLISSVLKEGNVNFQESVYYLFSNHFLETIICLLLVTVSFVKTRRYLRVG